MLAIWLSGLFTGGAYFAAFEKHWGWMAVFLALAVITGAYGLLGR